MTNTKIKTYLFLILMCAIGCGEATQNTEVATNQSMSLKQEKAAILKTLNNETKAAFQRDYEGWKDKWIQDSTIAKTYINFPKNSFTETIGWDEVSGFVKTYIDEHPEPQPVPAPLKDINVRLYENGAWVSYEQQDAVRGLKRETRLMEKVNGQWRIAGMHTTIYGFQDKTSDKK